MTSTLAMRLGLVVLAGMLLSARAEEAEENAFSVENETITLGGVEVAPGTGWFRASADVEAEKDANVLVYASNSADPEKAEARYLVRFNKAIDDFESEEHIARFQKIIQESLTEDGWVKGSVTVGTNALACYQSTDEESGGTVYMIMLPFGLHAQTVYVLLPKANAGLPKSAAQMLGKVRLGK
jgi:hypothetical protein